MEVTIGQFAKLVGSTVRTIRYYDKMGLLIPKKYNSNGRKVYTRYEWEVFQQITILKHFGLSLKEIKEHITNQKLDNRELLLVQKQLIEEKIGELNENLEVINRMDRMYNIEGISEEELNEFAFIMLDLFSREKLYIQLLEEYFKDDKQYMNEIKRLHEPDYKEKMDSNMWRLIQAIRNAMKYNDSESKEKVREIVSEMDALFPADKSLLNLIEDDQFLAKRNHIFTNYFPENIALYIHEELKRYYDAEKDRENE
ncbi:MerR family transcriptional regulator [Alteribacter lacisalsi]|uniref:MerR family transcriptional regulator n=1 Tax=Alteribacter lacisalsi TaxID=2045244 RepID=A0A2W0HQX4_9BACI|nr:MerR family transcriptional regulator [Alteribacter lacisalsi]PYZ95978.1 MerR family transcriptional regulator [Alteribacter lacisalsi]